MKVYIVVAVVEDFWDVFKRNVACYDSRPAAERHALAASAASAAIFERYGKLEANPPAAGSDEWMATVAGNTLDLGIWPSCLSQYEVEEFEVRKL